MPPRRHSTALALRDGLDQVEPLAALDRPGDAVDAGRPQRTDRVALAKAVAVDELLDGRLVGAVVTGGPGGMGLVQGPVVENLLVDGAGGDEHETPDIGMPGCLDQLQGAEDVLLDELQHVALAAPKAAAGMVQGGVDHGIAALDETGTPPFGLPSSPGTHSICRSTASNPPRSLSGRYQQRQMCPWEARWETM